MDETPQAGGGILSTLTRTLKTLRDSLENRIELFVVEWKEERLRLFGTILLAATGAVCAFMALIVISFTLVVIFWDTHRLLVVVLLAAVYAVASVTAFALVRSRLRNWQPFSATLDQIKKDRECFEKPE